MQLEEEPRRSPQSEGAAEPPYVTLARQALPVRLVGQALQEPQPPVTAPHHTLCQPARPSPGSARAFQVNSELAQRVCFYEVGGLACAAPPWATMSAPHKLTGSAEVTSLSWTSVSTSV